MAFDEKEISNAGLELLCSVFWIYEIPQISAASGRGAYSGAALIKFFFCPKCGAYSRAALI